MMQALIFDCDGVLVDTERDGHRVAFNQAFAQLGIDCVWSIERYGELLGTAGGKERMRRLMEVVRHGRVDLTPLLTHTFALDDIGEAYNLFGERLDGVMKVAIRP